MFFMKGKDECTKYRALGSFGQSLYDPDRDPFRN